MADSGKTQGDCRHARTPEWCVDCLREEVARLKRGEFSPAELNALCYDLHESRPGCTLADFRAGCLAFQAKLYGPDAVQKEVSREMCGAMRQVTWAGSTDGCADALAAVLVSNLAEEVEG